MKKALYLLGILTIIGCQKNGSDKNFEMYDMSDMAKLMEDMYDTHKEVRSDILEGKDIGTFPMEYEEIHSASFTKASFDTPEFQTYADAFLEAEEALYDAPDSLSRVNAYNNAINSCLSCHQTVGCPGPIPRIKKLKINQD